jgi:nitrogen fixation protein FixH
MESNKSSGKIWPIAIGISIALVFSLGIGTIIVTGKADIQLSDSYMTNYQNADANINDFIKDRIAFNKDYSIAYLTPSISKDGTNIRFSVKDKKTGKNVDDAKIVISVSRPETEKFTKTYKNPTYKDGVYSFNDVKFPKDGIWNIVTKFEVAKDSRFLNIKVDTRNDKIKYFD